MVIESEARRNKHTEFKTPSKTRGQGGVPQKHLATELAGAVHSARSESLGVLVRALHWQLLPRVRTPLARVTVVAHALASLGRLEKATAAHAPNGLARAAERAWRLGASCTLHTHELTPRR